MAEASENLRRRVNWLLLPMKLSFVIFCVPIWRELAKALLPWLGLWTVPVSLLTVGAVYGLIVVGLTWLFRNRRSTDAEPGAAADPAS